MPLPRARRYRTTPARTYKVVNRRGDYLASAEVPFEWTDREPMALAFRTRQAAERFVERRFVGRETARTVLGIRVVP